MKTQRGIVMIMVLIFLGVGGLTIAPTLAYASSALKFARVSRESSWAKYAVDGLAQQALWKLQYDTLFICDPTPTAVKFSDCVASVGSWTLTTKALPTQTPLRPYTLVEKLNDQDASVRVEVPGALTAAPAPTPTPTAAKCFYTWATRDKTWVQVGKPITYTIWVASCSSSGSSVNLRRLAFLMPPGFNYVAGSSNTAGNMTLNDPQITNCTGAAADGNAGPFFGCLQNDSAPLLDWPSGTTNFTGGSAITLKAGDPPVKQTIKVVPTQWGVFYVEPLVCYFSAATGNFGPCAGDNGIKGGKQAPVVVGMFNIQGQGKGYAYGASSKLDDAGSDLISQQPK